MRFVWQYQAKVEPLEPTLYVAQNLDWLQPTNQPVVEVAQPAHYDTPFVAPTDAAATNAGWLQETSQPVFLQPTAIQPDVPFVVEKELHLQHILDWLRPTEQPLFEAPRPTFYDVPFVAEPTLYVEQNLDWLRETNRPVFTPAFPVPAAVPFIAEATLAPEVAFDWYRPTEQPPDAAPRNHALYGVDATIEAIWAGAVTWTTVGDTFLYTATNWRRVSFWFEVKFRAPAGTAYARVLDLTTGVPVPFSVLSTTSSTNIRVRTATAITLTDGDEYVSQVGAILTGGGVGDIRAAKLIGVET